MLVYQRIDPKKIQHPPGGAGPDISAQGQPQTLEDYRAAIQACPSGGPGMSWPSGREQGDGGWAGSVTVAPLDETDSKKMTIYNQVSIYTL